MHECDESKCNYCNFCADCITCENIKETVCEGCNLILCETCRHTRGHWDDDEGVYYCENCWDEKVQNYVAAHFSLVHNQSEMLVGIATITKDHITTISKRGLSEKF